MILEASKRQITFFKYLYLLSACVYQTECLQIYKFSALKEYFFLAHNKVKKFYIVYIRITLFVEKANT